MRALTVVPGDSGSLALLDLPEPAPGPDDLLVQGLAMGVCGTDGEIVAGEYGEPEPGNEHLVLGHESLGRVISAPPDSAFGAGDLVTGVVRRPDPQPCGACARGEFDMCRNGRYTERGIKQLDGYGSQRWTVDAEFAVPVDAQLGLLGVLVEPTSVVAKAWDQIARIGARSWFEPATALVTGAGPIGLLAALLGVQRGLDVHVFDQVTSGPKPGLVADLGATYHDSGMDEVAAQVRPDVVIEATGAGSVVLDAVRISDTCGIVCLTGLGGGRRLSFDAAALNRTLVLENDVVFGSVNANLTHYTAAVEALRHADRDWLARLLTRSVPLESFWDAFTQQPDDVKTVLLLH